MLFVALTSALVVLSVVVIWLYTVCRRARRQMCILRDRNAELKELHSQAVAGERHRLERKLAQMGAPSPEREGPLRRHLRLIKCGGSISAGVVGAGLGAWFARHSTGAQSGAVTAAALLIAGSVTLNAEWPVGLEEESPDSTSTPAMPVPRSPEVEYVDGSTPDAQTTPTASHADASPSPQPDEGDQPEESDRVPQSAPGPEDQPTDSPSGGSPLDEQGRSDTPGPPPGSGQGPPDTPEPQRPANPPGDSGGNGDRPLATPPGQALDVPPEAADPMACVNAHVLALDLQMCGP